MDCFTPAQIFKQQNTSKDAFLTFRGLQIGRRGEYVQGARGQATPVIDLKEDDALSWEQFADFFLVHERSYIIDRPFMSVLRHIWHEKLPVPYNRIFKKIQRIVSTKVKRGMVCLLI